MSEQLDNGVGIIIPTLNEEGNIENIINDIEQAMDEIAYIGDDLNDLEALKAVGFSALSGNSPIQDQITTDYITKRHGGYGAFRELADIIINAQK